jgi:site-specific recombinase XerD
MAQEGLRCIEVASLQLGDIDMLDWFIRVVGKGGHERYLPLSEETIRAIRDYLGEYPASSGTLIRSYVHPTDGIRPATIGNLVSECMKAAGVKGRRSERRSAHSLRHSAAQHILDHGATIEQVREILGHRDLSSTAIYLKRRHAVTELRSAMTGREYRR